MYVKQKKLNEGEQFDKLVDATLTKLELDKKNEATEREIPLTTGTFDAKTAYMVPRFETIVDHGSKTVSGFAEMNVDGVLIQVAASSSCHPTDEYDEWIGYSLVMARLCDAMRNGIKDVILNRAESKGMNLSEKDLNL